MAREGVHERVGELLSDVPRGRVLDIPAGHGALAVKLRELGHEVSACDLYPELFEATGIDIRQGDLNARLPYEDGSFDHIACIEGLEHINDPQNAIGEFARLLRTGGTLVVSVPNIMNIEERLKWLFTGYTSHFKPLSAPAREQIAAEYGGLEEVALHVNPIGYSELRYLLEKNGFRLDAVSFDSRKSRSWMFWPIVAMIRLSSRFSSSARRAERWTDELNSDEVLLGGNTLIFKATRS